MSDLYNPTVTVVPGRWYIGPHCEKCEQPIPLAHEDFDGKLNFEGLGRIRASCPSCGHDTSYEASTIQRFLAHAKA